MNSLSFSYPSGFVVAWEAVKPTQAWGAYGLVFIVSLRNLGRVGNLVIYLSLSSLNSLDSLYSLSALNKICRQSAADAVLSRQITSGFSHR